MDQRQILSIIILSYESEKNIESITRKVIHTMKEENIPFEIIIMDDGSKDQSYRIAQNLSEMCIRDRRYSSRASYQ